MLSRAPSYGSRSQSVTGVTVLAAASYSWIWHSWLPSSSAAVRATVLSTSSRSTLELIARVDWRSSPSCLFWVSVCRSSCAWWMAAAACSPRAAASCRSSSVKCRSTSVSMNTRNPMGSPS